MLSGHEPPGSASDLALEVKPSGLQGLGTRVKRVLQLQDCILWASECCFAGLRMGV